MWDNLSYYNVSTERKALEIIFDYLQLDMLTKPECSLASNNYPLSQGLTLSKEPEHCRHHSTHFAAKYYLLIGKLFCVLPAPINRIYEG